jgi:hypothetical protein
VSLCASPGRGLEMESRVSSVAPHIVHHIAITGL